VRLSVALLVFRPLFMRFCQIADLIVKHFFLITRLIYLLFCILYIGLLRKNNIQLYACIKWALKKNSINTKSVAIF
jgi:hypothetical protein